MTKSVVRYICETALFDVILLMVQKSSDHHLGMYKCLVNNGINYQPQLMQDFLHQQYASIWNLNLSSFNELNKIWREIDCCRDDLVKGDFLTHNGWYHIRFRLAQFEHEKNN